MVKNTRPFNGSNQVNDRDNNFSISKGKNLSRPEKGTQSTMTLAQEKGIEPVFVSEANIKKFKADFPDDWIKFVRSGLVTSVNGLVTEP